MTMVVPMDVRRVGGELLQTVNARELHRDLDSRQDFSTWIKARIEQGGFIEDQDYVVHKFVDNPLGGRPTLDYFLTLEMAKHLCMMERNEKGKQIRQYFIECEKETRVAHPILPVTHAKHIIKETLEVGGLLSVPLHVLQTTAVKEAKRVTGHDFTPLLEHAPAQQNIQEEEKMLEPTALGKLHGIGAVKVNQILAAAGWQVKVGESWTPTPLGQQYCVANQWNKSHGKSGYNYRWNVGYTSRLIEAHLAASLAERAAAEYGKAQVAAAKKVK